MSAARTTTTAPDFYDLNHVANAIGMSRRSVVRHIKAGTFPLPVLTIGKRRVVGRIAFERAIAGDTFAGVSS